MIAAIVVINAVLGFTQEATSFARLGSEHWRNGLPAGGNALGEPGLRSSLDCETGRTTATWTTSASKGHCRADHDARGRDVDRRRQALTLASQSTRCHRVTCRRAETYRRRGRPRIARTSRIIWLVKPHSLSYQAMTLTNVPSTTHVRSRSTTAARGSPTMSAETMGFLRNSEDAGVPDGLGFLTEGVVHLFGRPRARR